MEEAQAIRESVKPKRGSIKKILSPIQQQSEPQTPDQLTSPKAANIEDLPRPFTFVELSESSPVDLEKGQKRGMKVRMEEEWEEEGNNNPNNYQGREQEEDERERLKRELKRLEE